MRVKDLIGYLRLLPEDAIVVLSSDGGGGNHSPLASISAGSYLAHNTWSGEFSDTEGHWPTDAVCLWPID